MRYVFIIFCVYNIVYGMAVAFRGCPRSSRCGRSGAKGHVVPNLPHARRWIHEIPCSRVKVSYADALVLIDGGTSPKWIQLQARHHQSTFITHICVLHAVRTQDDMSRAWRPSLRELLAMRVHAVAAHDLFHTAARRRPPKRRPRSCLCPSLESLV